MKFILFLIPIFLMFISPAQKPEIRVTMLGIGDNREFDNGLSRSQTILGALGSVEIGTAIDRNSFFTGISELYEFGSRINFHIPRLIMYYRYADPNKVFQFGSFPRLGEIDFPLAMLADTLIYFRPQIEGLLGKISGKWGNQLAFVDWTGRQTATVRESFMAGTSGEFTFQKWFIQDFVLLHHLAHSSQKPPDQHIRDYFGYGLLCGIRMGDERGLNGQFKAGLISSVFRERSVTDGFIIRKGFLFEGNCHYHRFTIKTTLYSGEKLQFALGDPLYRSTGYLRNDLVWNFIRYKNLSARFNWSLHWINWNEQDHSQQMFLIFRW